MKLEWTEVGGKTMSDDRRSLNSIDDIEFAVRRIDELEAKLKWVLKERDATFELMLKRAETAEASLEKVKDLVERAFVEGCHEGMNEFATSRGGKTWEESRTIKMLSTVKGQDDD